MAPSTKTTPTKKKSKTTRPQKQAMSASQKKTHDHSDSTVYIKYCNEYEVNTIEQIIKDAFKSLNITFKPKQTVLLKPNILLAANPSQMVTTHPVVFEAICRYLTKKKVTILIGESSGTHQRNGTYHAFKISGLWEISLAYDVTFISFDKDSKVMLHNEQNTKLKEFPVAQTLTEVDYIINLPKLKTHTLMNYTGAVKNLYGCIPGGLKQQYHGTYPKAKDFAEVLVDIYQTLPPTISLMDGIIGMEGQGPSSGKPAHADHILISRNAAALDEVAFRLIGFSSNEVPTSSICQRRNLLSRPLLKGDYTSLSLIPHTQFEKPAQHKTPPLALKFFFSSQMKIPKANKKACVKCGICADHCPVDAIEMQPFPKINKRTCIRCYCCHELCPYNAIDLIHPVVQRTIYHFLHVVKKVLGR